MNRPEAFADQAQEVVPALTLLPEVDKRSEITTAFGRITLFGGECLANAEEIAQAGQHAVGGDITALTDLPGSYSGFLATNEGNVAFSGLSGRIPLYYQYSSAGVLVSSNPCNPGLERNGIDRVTLGAQIGLPMGLLCENYSLFEGIKKLGPGEMLRTRHLGQQDTPREMYETFAPSPSGSLEDAALATREALVEAIERRLMLEEHAATLDWHYEPRITADLSGGLDSSSLAYLAAWLNEKPIDAFAQYHPDHRVGDIGYARLLGHPHPDIRLHEIAETDDELPFSVLSPAELPFNPREPHRTASIYRRQMRRIRAARHVHSTLHLIGTGGDALYDSNVFIADLLMKGQDDRFETDGTRLARTTLYSPELYKRRARMHASYSLAHAWQQLAEVLGNPAERQAFDVGWLPTLNRNFDWLTPEIRVLLQERAALMAKQAKTDLLIGDYRTIGQIQDSGDAQRHLMFLEGDTVHAPFLDHRVIRAALKCEAYERTQAEEGFKSVIKRALGSLCLHKRLLERHTKGDYAALTAAGLQKAQGHMLALLPNSRLAALGIINPKAVQEALYYQDLDGQGKAYFEPFLAAEIWLRQREKWYGEYIEQPPFSAAAPTPEVFQVPAESEALLGKKVSPGNWLTCATGQAGQMVLFDHVTGQLAPLNRTESLILKALVDTNDPGEAVRRLAEHYPQFPSSWLRADVAKKIQDMLKKNWLTLEVDKEGLPWMFRPTFIKEQRPCEENMSMRVGVWYPETHAEAPVSEAEKRLGRQALDLACKLRDKSFLATKIHLIETYAKENGRRDYAESETVRRYMHILRHVSYEPAYEKRRLACFELSLASVLMASAQNKVLHWAIGVAFDPQPTMHSWVETSLRERIDSDGQDISRFEELFHI